MYCHMPHVQDKYIIIFLWAHNMSVHLEILSDGKPLPMAIMEELLFLQISLNPHCCAEQWHAHYSYRLGKNTLLCQV